MIKVFASISGSHAHALHRPQHHGRNAQQRARHPVHNFWDRGLLGMALHPNFPTTPYVYVLYTHDAAIGGTAPRWGNCRGRLRFLPQPPGGDLGRLCGQRAPLPPSGRRRCDERLRAGAGRGLVPAVPLALHRHGRLRSRRGPLCERRRRAPASTSPTTARTAARLNPCGDPPGGVGATLTPPTAEGGALRAQDLRTSADPVLPRWLHHPRGCDHRRRPAHEPLGRKLRSQRAAHHRARASQPLPLRLPPRHQRALDRRRGLERVRGDQPHPQPLRLGARELRLALL